MRSVTLTLLEVVTLLGCITIVLAGNQTKERGIITALRDSDDPDPYPLPVYTDRCGMRNTDGLAFRMIGREDYESEYGEFPWMVAILRTEDVLRQTNEKVPHCGGSLIHNQVVLTATHCINRMLTSELTVRAGEWDTKTDDELYLHQDRSVVEFVIHPEYHKGALNNDVALLFLESPFQLNEAIQPVCLPPQDAKFEHQTCFATAWGKNAYGKTDTVPVILRKLVLPIVPDEECQSALRTTKLGPKFVLHKSFICISGVPGKDTCKADGGSPLVCPIPNTQHQYYQAGFAMWRIGCGENGVPGVYGNVAMFRNWIDQQMIERNFGTSSYTA